MQASPSNHADGKRPFPSPFTAPIQAARRLLERPSPADENDSDYAPGPSPEARAASSYGLNNAGRREMTYDEAAIVASLDAGLESAESASFEEIDLERKRGEPESGADADARAAIDLPFGRAPLVSLRLDFRANRGPDLRWDRGPDPSAVRAAISRLAEESRSRELQSRKSRSRDEEAKETETAGRAAAFADAVAFEDVARRVWGGIPGESETVRVQTESSQPVADSGVSAPPNDGTVRKEAAGELLPIVAVTDSAERGSAAALPPPAAFAAAGLSSQAESWIEPTAVSSAPSVEEDKGSCLDLTAEAGECLAHDAGNLLAAMRLYSELLSISGVLQERHRHYADDLKLLATRSQQLIDRLLKLGERLAQPPVANDEATSEILGEPSSESDVFVLSGADAGASPALISIAAVEAREPLNHGNVQVAKPNRTPTAPDAPAAEVFPERTDVAAVLKRIGNVLYTLSHGALTIDPGPDASMPVAIGLEPLERILVNLVANATAAIQGDGGAIRIRATVLPEQASPGAASGETLAGHFTNREAKNDDGGELVLTVDDSGCGMNALQIEQALGAECGEPQTGPSVPGSRRRGLGLRIVRELVAASGGRLAIESQPGVGTRIQIRWPVPIAALSLRHRVEPVVPETAPEDVSPALARKPVAVARVGAAPTGNTRIRAGAGSEGVVAC